MNISTRFLKDDSGVFTIDYALLVTLIIVNVLVVLWSLTNELLWRPHQLVIPAD